jgi:hypothetical protein
MERKELGDGELMDESHFRITEIVGESDSQLKNYVIGTNEVPRNVQVHVVEKNELRQAEGPK